MIPKNKPTWLYKPVKVSNLVKVQKEVLDLQADHYSDLFKGRGFCFVYLDKELLKTQAPSYVQMLSSLGLDDRWTSSIIIGTTGTSRLEDSAIHIDTENWQERCYGLNIPLLNCEESWTVWYDAKERDPNGYLGDEPHTGWGTARSYTNNATEIGRMPATETAWVNVCVPHRPECDHSNTRLILSTRFWPEVHEYVND